MKTHLFLQLLLFLLLLVSSSEALFFNYPKNALLNFFNSLREKKELKKPPPPDIHHYHLHYYPVHVQNIHTSMKSLKAPDKHELEAIHTNKLENYGWTEHEFRFVPDPVVHHAPSISVEPWSMSESHVYHRPESDWDTGAGTVGKPEELDRHSEESIPHSVGHGKSGGIVVQVPLHQQIILQQPVRVEKPKETHPFVAFFEKLKNFKNSLFPTDDVIEEKSDKFPDKLNAFIVYTNPSRARRLR